MNIGNLILQNNLFLAPMAGVTDRAYREITKPFGVGMMYSEMISAKGLFYQSDKTADLLQMSELERPLGVQIFGSEPEIMAKIVDKALSFGGELIDINMGCPAPKIVNNGDGCALMKNPKLAAEILRAVKNASFAPVTVKIRAGWDMDSINAVETAKYLEDAGADAITVHGRTREQFYSGVADLSVITDVVRAVNIPIIGNGDVKSLADAANMVRQTGCAGVMIGRAAMGNPWIFSGEKPSLEERLSVTRQHIALMVEYKGEYRAIKEARKVLSWYFAGIPGATKLRKEVNVVETLDDVEKLLEKVEKEARIYG